MKKIFVLIIVLASFVCVNAQNNPGGDGQHRRASIEEFFQMKIDFVIKDLKLSAADSAKFAPMYKEYMQAKGELMRSAVNGRAVGMKLMKHEPVTADDYMAATRGELDFKVKEAQLAKEWFEKFEAVLTPEQLFTLLRSEERFAADMMTRHGRRGEGNKGNRGAHKKEAK